MSKSYGIKNYHCIFDSNTMDIISDFFYDEKTAWKAYNKAKNLFSNRKLGVGDVSWDLDRKRITSSDPAGMKIMIGTRHGDQGPKIVQSER